jgi:hypothetical protein
MNSSNSIIVYRSQSEKIIDEALTSAGMFPFYVSVFAFILAYVLIDKFLGSCVKKLLMKVFKNKGSYKLNDYQTRINLVLSAIVSFLVFKYMQI